MIVCSGFLAGHGRHTDRQRVLVWICLLRAQVLVVISYALPPALVKFDCPPHLVPLECGKSLLPQHQKRKTHKWQKRLSVTGWATSEVESRVSKVQSEEKVPKFLRVLCRKFRKDKRIKPTSHMQLPLLVAQCSAENCREMSQALRTIP